jgi:hypothetical protein
MIFARSDCVNVHQLQLVMLARRTHPAGPAAAAGGRDETAGAGVAGIRSATGWKRGAAAPDGDVRSVRIVGAGLLVWRVAVAPNRVRRDAARPCACRRQKGMNILLRRDRFLSCCKLVPDAPSIRFTDTTETELLSD